MEWLCKINIYSNYPYNSLLLVANRSSSIDPRSFAPLAMSCDVSDQWFTAEVLTLHCPILRGVHSGVVNQGKTMRFT